jgi:hypothetical protein
MASTSKAKGKELKAANKASELSSFVDTHGVIVTTMNDLPGYRM